MKAIAIVTIAVGCLGIFGCSEDFVSAVPVYAASKHLNVGMTPEEVRAIVGEAVLTGQLNEQDYLDFSAPGDENGAAEAKNDDWAVIDSESRSRWLLLDFEAGKLQSWKIKDYDDGPKP